MDHTEQPTLNYTEDFIISCAISRLLPEEVLANFMGLLNVTYYALKIEDNITNAANRAVVDYIQSQKGVRKINKEHRYAHTKCRDILHAIVSDPDLKAEQKIRQLKSMVQWCIRYLSNKFSLVTRVQLPDKRYLKLSGNFVLLCFMQAIDPVKLLQSFIDHISWSKYFALNGSEESDNDPWMGFISNMEVDYFQLEEELFSSGFFDQHEKMAALRETMNDEPDYDKRLSAFKNCLKKMYDSLHKEPIKPCFLSEFID